MSPRYWISDRNHCEVLGFSLSLTGRGLSERKPYFLSCEANMSLGILPDAKFEGEFMTGFKGTPLFLYTDGLNEAENPEHEIFGSDRLLAVLGKPYTDAETTVKRMQTAIAEHVAGANASDDLTMVCLEIKK